MTVTPGSGPLWDRIRLRTAAVYGEGIARGPGCENANYPGGWE